MFDLRYHVASLTAVFFALVIGILVGVALATHGLGNTERSRLQRQIDIANANLDSARNDLIQAQEDKRADSAFVDSAYKTVMTDRLQGRHVAVLFVGKKDGELLNSITQTLEDADAPQRLRLSALSVPLDDAAIDRVLARRPQLAAYVGEEKLGDLGRELAHEFVIGGDTPLWDALQRQLVEEKTGSERRPADAVVIARTVQPQVDGTARFLHGFYRGLEDAAGVVVGVEASRSKPSAVPTFQRDFSTVDNIDTKVGRVALALLLADAPGGSYGTKKTASDGVLPEVLPVVPSSAGG
jgi:hypothetical protein